MGLTPEPTREQGKKEKRKENSEEKEQHRIQKEKKCRVQETELKLGLGKINRCSIQRTR